MTITIGLKTNTHVFICSQSQVAESIIKVKDGEDRTVHLGNVMLNVTGDQADAFRFSLLCSETAKLLALQYSAKITPGFLCDIASRNIHAGLRSNQLKCSSVIAGIENGTELYAVDSYGAAHSDNFVVTGYGLYFLYGLFDAYYGEDMGVEEVKHFLMLCLRALKDRLVIETSSWNLDVMGVDGSKTKEEITN
ncbi:20S proteasome subunit beta 4 [Pancytospora epiphaga]|nr:20S proteasome subunit beta 4 [Pancytospora epiphaga]